MICERTVKSFCKDDISKIENYDKAIKDTSQTWDCHHRLEITINGEKALTLQDLRRFGMYLHRPYFELIFLPKDEHHRLHMLARGQGGSKNPMYGTTPWNKGLKGKVHVEEDRKKRYSELYKGKHWRLVNGKRQWY